MPSKKGKYTPEQVVEALRKTEGMAFLAADLLGSSVSTVYRYAERYPAVKEIIEHTKGVRLDTAESSMWSAVKDSEPWAVCFYLKTQGKARGYVERQEIEATAKARLEIVEEITDGGQHGPPDGPAAPGAGGVPPV